MKADMHPLYWRHLFWLNQISTRKIKEKKQGEEATLEYWDAPKVFHWERYLLFPFLNPRRSQDRECLGSLVTRLLESGISRKTALCDSLPINNLAGKDGWSSPLVSLALLSLPVPVTTSPGSQSRQSPGTITHRHTFAPLRWSFGVHHWVLFEFHIDGKQEDAKLCWVDLWQQ